jgi:hypothetical protein
MCDQFIGGWQDPPFPIPLLPGPRTTNHAEGWHNRLNHDFGHPHPAFNKFLHWLQEAHHANQVRIRQLQNDHQPRLRNPTYVRVDRNIAKRKIEFRRERELLPVNGGQNEIMLLAEAYLRYIIHQM